MELLGRRSGQPACARRSLKRVNFHVWSPRFTGFGGGITAFSRELAMALQDLGHEVRLFGKLDKPGPAVLQTSRFAVATLLACARDRPDHLISTHLNFGPLAGLAKRVLGTPFTLVAHGIDVHEGLGQARRAGLRAADRVLAVSSWTRQRLVEMGGVDPARVAVVANTFDETRFTAGARPQALAQRYRIGSNERVVLTVGRLDPHERYKGYDQVVRALPSIRAACGPVRYLVIGEGEDRARLEAMARDAGLGQAVSCLGFVPDEELAEHYRLADVFAMPSSGEGFGIVFLEAMACGTPVLAGNRDGAVDALERGRLGPLVDPGDVEAIAQGVIALLKKQGPGWWFDRQALHDAVSRSFGRAAFRERLRKVLS